MTPDDAPRKVSDRRVDVVIDGYLTAFVNGRPFALAMPGTPDVFIAVFSTKEKLEALFRDYDLKYDSIKQIENGREFLDSVIAHYRVAIDPYKHTNGRLRYVEPVSFGARSILGRSAAVLLEMMPPVDSIAYWAHPHEGPRPAGGCLSQARGGGSVECHEEWENSHDLIWIRRHRINAAQAQHRRRGK